MHPLITQDHIDSTPATGCSCAWLFDGFVDLIAEVLTRIWLIRDPTLQKI